MPSIDHIGIAVDDVEAVTAFFSRLFEVAPYKTEDVVAQDVRTHFIDAGSTKIELLESLSGESPISKYVRKRGEGIHHLAFEVPNIDAAWRRAKSLGYETIGEGPTPGADDKTIFFLHPKLTHGMLIEFCQSQRKPLEAEWIPFRGGRLASYPLGDPNRPPIVVLHGAAGCTAMETELLARRLSRHFKVYALDFAAHGRSDPFEDAPFSPQYLVDNVSALLEYYELDRPHVFGFSLGGFIALSFAVQYPNRVQKLAVHAANLFWDAPLVEKMTSRVDAAAIQADTPRLAHYLAEMHGPGWVSLFERTRAYTENILAFEPFYRQATTAGADTLVSAVHDDDLFTIDSPVNLHKRLKNSKLAIVPGRRHAFQNVDLDVYFPMVLRHFKQR